MHHYAKSQYNESHLLSQKTNIPSQFQNPKMNTACMHEVSN